MSTPTAAQPIQARVDLALAPEEALGCRRRRRAPDPGTGRRAPGSGRAAATTSDGSWRRIACSNATSSEPGSTPSSVTSVRAGLVQRAQGVTLPAGLVLGQRQQRPPALAQRRLGRAGLRLGEHLAMVARTQGGLQADLLGVEAELLEPAGLDPTGVPTLELAQRRPPPQRQRLAAHVGGPVVLAQRQQLRAAPGHPLEAVRVHLVGRRRQAVARR